MILLLAGLISRDPIGILDGINLYVYVKNNPTNWMDPDGHSIRDPGKTPGGSFPFPPCPHPPTSDPGPCDGVIRWVQLPSGECAWICVIWPTRPPSRPRTREGCPSGGGGEGGPTPPKPPPRRPGSSGCARFIAGAEYLCQDCCNLDY